LQTLESTETTLSVIEGRYETKLRRELGIVFTLLEEVGTEDVVLNPDGRLWVRRTGNPFVSAGVFPPSQALSALSTIAHYRNMILDESHPILETKLPFNGARVEGLIPPVVDAPSFAMRPRATTVYTLQSCVDKGMLSPAHFAALQSAIEEKLNILVVGGTGSGKTTFANALLAEMVNATPHDRVAIVEDTGELQCKMPNAIQLLAAEPVTMNDCMKACMRLKPDRIIVGEVRGKEALELLNAWNTGHPGGFATIHADSAFKALARFESLIEGATSVSKQQFIAQALNRVVFIAPDRSIPAGRRVMEVLHVKGYEDGRYVVNNL
jgi:type IV secretion system protein TrbB